VEKIQNLMHVRANRTHAAVSFASGFGERRRELNKPAPYTIGNAPRALGWVHNPDSQNFDFSLTKNTRFGDRYNVQIRMEMFNAFNHPNLGSVDSNFGDQTFDSSGNRTGGNFGTVPTGSFSNSSRQIQLAAKFYY
jgi:hypothetical protein